MNDIHTHTCTGWYTEKEAATHERRMQKPEEEEEGENGKDSKKKLSWRDPIPNISVLSHPWKQRVYSTLGNYIIHVCKKIDIKLYDSASMSIIFPFASSVCSVIHTPHTVTHTIFVRFLSGLLKLNKNIRALVHTYTSPQTFIHTQKKQIGKKEIKNETFSVFPFRLFSFCCFSRIFLFGFLPLTPAYFLLIFFSFVLWSYFFPESSTIWCENGKQQWRQRTKTKKSVEKTNVFFCVWNWSAIRRTRITHTFSYRSVQCRKKAGKKLIEKVSGIGYLYDYQLRNETCHCSIEWYREVEILYKIFQPEWL